MIFVHDDERIAVEPRCAHGVLEGLPLWWRMAATTSLVCDGRSIVPAREVLPDADEALEFQPSDYLFYSYTEGKADPHIGV